MQFISLHQKWHRDLKQRHREIAGQLSKLNYRHWFNFFTKANLGGLLSMRLPTETKCEHFP